MARMISMDHFSPPWELVTGYERDFSWEPAPGL
jgi:hypothetical protein